MRGLSDRSDNILSAIAADIADLRLAEAREKLAAAREVQSEVLRKPLAFNAALMERQAEIALLESKPDHAFTLFSAAADSFAAIGPVEVARHRRAYADKLLTHGNRFGGAALSHAKTLLQRLLADLPREIAPREWAAAKNSIALVFLLLGQRSREPEGSALLSDAVRAFEECIQVVAASASPVDWATAMQNLGATYKELAYRSRREMRPQLLSKAIYAYENVLTVFTSELRPLDWAETTQNLGNSLRALALCTTGDSRIELLSRAVACLQDSLKVRTRSDRPQDWAKTMQNLGVALIVQGEMTEGAGAATLFRDAIDALTGSLQVRTPTDHPVDWAFSQMNLAVCFKAWANHPACSEKGTHLRQALTHVEAALTVFDAGHMPNDHDKAARLRANILSALADTP